MPLALTLGSAEFPLQEKPVETLLPDMLTGTCAASSTMLDSEPLMNYYFVLGAAAAKRGQLANRSPFPAGAKREAWLAGHRSAMPPGARSTTISIHPGEPAGPSPSSSDCQESLVRSGLLLPNF